MEEVKGYERELGTYSLSYDERSGNFWSSSDLINSEYTFASGYAVDMGSLFVRARVRKVKEWGHLYYRNFFHCHSGNDSR